jgi:hypothetical protein
MLRDVAITHAQSRIAYMPVLTEIFEIGHRKKLFTSPVDSTNVCLEQEKQITGKQEIIIYESRLHVMP